MQNASRVWPRRRAESGIALSHSHTHKGGDIQESSWTPARVRAASGKCSPRAAAGPEEGVAAKPSRSLPHRPLPGGPGGGGE